MNETIDISGLMVVNEIYECSKYKKWIKLKILTFG